jgi:hypothetical protein
VTATAAGAITAIANMTGYTNGTTTVTATAPMTPVLTSIKVTPSSGNLNVAGTQIFTATALNGSTPVAGINISWMVSNETVGNVSVSSGITDVDGNTTVMFTASETGTTLVNATNGSISDRASVNVQIPVLTSITISPANAVLDKKTTTTQVFTATTRDQMNYPMPDINITWTSNNPALGTLNASSMTGADGNASTSLSVASTGMAVITATNGSNSVNTTVIIADSIIDLNMGWNLISIPNFAAQNGVAQVLANVQYNAIWEFDAATMSFSTPSVINPLRGYWINVTAPDQKIGFIAAGIVVPSTPPSMNLYEGWNLIGVAASQLDDSNVPLNASVVFASLQNSQVGPLYSMMVDYQNLSSPYTIVGTDLNDSTPLKQGQGYWLFINPLVNYPRNNVLWAGKVW